MRAITRETRREQLAAMVSGHLREQGIAVVLVGGSVVTAELERLDIVRQQNRLAGLTQLALEALEDARKAEQERAAAPPPPPPPPPPAPPPIGRHVQEYNELRALAPTLGAHYLHTPRNLDTMLAERLFIQ